LMNNAGLIVITAFISPYRNDRQLARAIVGTENFVEVYINTPIEICEARDPKGMYKRARAGLIVGFTGVNDLYESPEAPDLTINTSIVSPLECTEKLLAEVKARIAVPEGKRRHRVRDYR